MMQLHRIDGLLDLALVKRQKIVFLGLGSLGSLTASNLLLYPWREVVLIDHDLFNEENVERHLLDKRDYNRPKVQGMKDWAINRGMDPNRITIHHGRAQEVLHLHTDADILVVNVDHKPSKSFINQWCHKHKIPAVYGGVYPLGIGGDITVIPTTEQVCYECADFMQGGIQEATFHPNYGVDAPTDDAPKVIPALRWAISSLASDMAGIVINALKGGDSTAYIQIRTFEWDGVMSFPTYHPQVRNLVSFIQAQKALGLHPTYRLTPKNGGKLELQIKQQTIQLQILQWNRCPYHIIESPTLADEI